MTPPGEQIISEIVEKTGDTSILSFSCGKDSIAAYLAIRDRFENIVPYFLYLVPGLEFVEESLDYFEGVFGRKIIRLPHPHFYGWLNDGVFQSPGNMAVIKAAQLPKFDYLDIHAAVCFKEDLPDTTMIASGVRAADSPFRRLAISTHGAISWNRKQYYPVWDWKKDRLIDEIRKSGIRLPVDYDLFSRSFDGLDLRFLLPLKQKRPKDYQKILEFFPLAEVEIFRYEKAIA